MKPKLGTFYYNRDESLKELPEGKSPQTHRRSSIFNKNISTLSNSKFQFGEWNNHTKKEPMIDRLRKNASDLEETLLLNWDMMMHATKDGDLHLRLASLKAYYAEMVKKKARKSLLRAKLVISSQIYESVKKTEGERVFEQEKHLADQKAIVENKLGGIKSFDKKFKEVDVYFNGMMEEKLNINSDLREQFRNYEIKKFLNENCNLLNERARRKLKLDKIKDAISNLKKEKADLKKKQATTQKKPLQSKEEELKKSIAKLIDEKKNLVNVLKQALAFQTNRRPESTVFQLNNEQTIDSPNLSHVEPNFEFDVSDINLSDSV